MLTDEKLKTITRPSKERLIMIRCSYRGMMKEMNENPHLFYVARTIRQLFGSMENETSGCLKKPARILFLP